MHFSTVPRCLATTLDFAVAQITAGAAAAVAAAVAAVLTVASAAAMVAAEDLFFLARGCVWCFFLALWGTGEPPGDAIRCAKKSKSHGKDDYDCTQRSLTVCAQ